MTRTAFFALCLLTSGCAMRGGARADASANLAAAASAAILADAEALEAERGRRVRVEWRELDLSGLQSPPVEDDLRSKLQRSRAGGLDSAQGGSDIYSLRIAPPRIQAESAVLLVTLKKSWAGPCGPLRSTMLYDYTFRLRDDAWLEEGRRTVGFGDPAPPPPGCVDNATVPQPISRVPGSPIAWRMGDVPVGGIDGRVVSSSEPFQSAVLVALPSHGISVLSENGRFSLRNVPPGKTEVVVQSVGYSTIRDTINMPWDRGVYAVVLMEQSSLEGVCGWMIIRSPGQDPEDLNVHVIDSITGKPVTGAVELRLEHDEGVRTVRTESVVERPNERIVLAGPIQTSGPHTLVITAPGYQIWRREGLDLWVAEGCTPKLMNGNQTARLVPRSQPVP